MMSPRTAKVATQSQIRQRSIRRGELMHLHSAAAAALPATELFRMPAAAQGCTQTAVRTARRGQKRRQLRRQPSTRLHTHTTAHAELHAQPGKHTRRERCFLSPRFTPSRTSNPASFLFKAVKSTEDGAAWPRQPAPTSFPLDSNPLCFQQLLLCARLC